MKLQRPLNTLAPITLALLCLVVQNAAHAETKEKKPSPSKAAVATPVTQPAAPSTTSTDINADRAAAVAARRDGDPAVNGSVRDFPPTDAAK
jgi:hypothetical protein